MCGAATKAKIRKIEAESCIASFGGNSAGHFDAKICMFCEIFTKVEYIIAID